MLKVFAGLIVVLALARANPAPEQPNLDCFSKDSEIMSCLAVKAISGINRVSRSPKVEILEGISLIREVPLERSSRALKSETEMLAELPRGATDKTMTLASQLFDSAVNFLKTHSLQVNPENGIARLSSETVSDLVGDETGSLKTLNLSHKFFNWVGKKTFGFIPMVLLAISAIVLKALVVSKIGLLIGAVLLFQKYVSGNPYWSNLFKPNFLAAQPAYSAPAYSAPAYAQPNYEVTNTWSSPNSNPGYSYRSYDTARLDAAKVAYSAQQPEIPTTNEAH